MDDFEQALQSPLVRAFVCEMWKKLGPLERSGMDLERLNVSLNREGRQVRCDVTVKGGSYTNIVPVV